MPVTRTLRRDLLPATSSPRQFLPRRGSVVCGGLAGALAGFLARDLGLADSASAWVPAALVGAALCIGRARALLATVLGALATVWLAAAFTPLSARLVEGLVRKDAPQKADAVVILGSRLQADGEPTTEASDRLAHGLELLAEGWAPRLVVSELPPPAASHAALARKAAAARGLAVEVLPVGPVRRTRDEAVAVAALCRERGWSRVLLVTSPLHSRRGALSMEREGVGVVSSPALETQFDLETLDRPAERLRAFASALHERLGLWYYEWKGWIRPGTGP
jgi:uncharacterized SAM-binding protein YcdF (DUF218 family)